MSGPPVSRHEADVRLPRAARGRDLGRHPCPAILAGNAGAVAAAITEQADREGFRGGERKNADAAAGYLTSKAAKLDRPPEHRHSSGAAPFNVGVTPAPAGPILGP